MYEEQNRTEEKAKQPPAIWQVSASPREGYYKTYSLNTDDGDLITVDFNNHRSMVHLCISINSEHHKEYISIMKSGTILRERDVTAGRPIDLFSRFSKFSRYFETLKDDMVLKAIGGNYNFPLEPEVSTRREELFRHIFEIKKPSFFQWIRDYLQRKYELENYPRPFYKKILRRMPAEIMDLTIGTILLYLIFVDEVMGMTAMAGVAGILGIFSGAIDWVWRQRAPFLPKVIFFMMIGVGAVYYQVQHRIWSIFL